MERINIQFPKRGVLATGIVMLNKTKIMVTKTENFFIKSSYIVDMY